MRSDEKTILIIRKHTLLALSIVTPLGFLFKLYSGPVHIWFNYYGAGLLYVIFWILVVFFFYPDKNAVKKIPVWVFCITCVLEILQLWHPWMLEKIRSFFLGRALIGTTFVWWDFFHYAAGSLIGWILIRWIGARDLNSS